MQDTVTSIIDNRDENTLLGAIQRMGAQGRSLSIATAFFSLDALLLLADTLEEYEHIRILFGDDANPKQRTQLLQMLRSKSDEDLLRQRESMPLLDALKKVAPLFTEGRIEARCYTAKKFHAKAYLVGRPDSYPQQMAVIGSGNFTRPGLLQNVELNVELTPEQTAQLQQWYEEMWAEAAEDVVTENVLDEIRRQIDLYDPYMLYLKALYAWGLDRQGLPSVDTTRLLRMLDKHQEDGYLQALKILQRHDGVMVCDGVGLGKSFIALSLMEHFLRDGKKVLLLAPKNIMANSWDGYLDEYLQDYRLPYGSIFETPMTSLGFDPEDGMDEKTARLVTALKRQADYIFIDESHNFRTTSSNRYKNLFDIVDPATGKPKKVVMLTATPINTAYQDISAQLAIATHDGGSIGGYTIQQIRRYAVSLDNDKPQDVDLSGQLALQIAETPNEALNRVLAQVVIQRSRKTCKELSKAVGRPLRFPKRKDPECVEYKIGKESNEYRELIAFADRVFRPGIAYVNELKAAVEQAAKEGKQIDPRKFAKGPADGIKLAAFLPAQYRREPVEGQKQYSDEVHLAGLVFSNALKQLESSPVAFQGIIQSIAMGLLARLKVVFDTDVSQAIAEHGPWVRTQLFPAEQMELDTPEDEDIEISGDTLDASGDEPDEWLDQAISSRGLHKKLRDFKAEDFEVDRWRDDIVADLNFLRQIHAAILKARKQPDAKLDKVCPIIMGDLEQKRRVLVFTQSRRTAEYLEQELKRRCKGYNVARIDSRIESDRRANILYSFCPMYNKKPEKVLETIPGRIDVLISTDVLSEGVNLQEAEAILNYDIHWNPVRLIQRIGRVDRRLSEDDPRPDPSFAIYNVLPPPEIEKIINLVGSVERRTLKISRALGIDVSFFKSTDPAGNLKEFNSRYEGEMSAIDVVSRDFAAHFAEPDERLIATLEGIPPGAFGVWGNAPQDGLFALFTMEPTDNATDADKEKYAQVIGRPVLALEHAKDLYSHDAGAILTLLAHTRKGDPSATPSDEQTLANRLMKLKNSVRRQFSDISLPNTIRPSLVCWMELRKGN